MLWGLERVEYRRVIIAARLSLCLLLGCNSFSGARDIRVIHTVLWPVFPFAVSCQSFNDCATCCCKQQHNSGLFLVLTHQWLTNDVWKSAASGSQQQDTVGLSFRCSQCTRGNEAQSIKSMTAVHQHRLSQKRFLLFSSLLHRCNTACWHDTHVLYTCGVCYLAVCCRPVTPCEVCKSSSQHSTSLHLM